jgi:16S rRNA (uracil1498-N3)-methyltransferase
LADRFYCPDSPVDGRVSLEGDEARHLIRVRRVARGECVEIFDGRGSAIRAEVTELGRDRVELAVQGPAVSIREPRCSLTLATAVPKGERFDWLVEKATELGVARLTPIVTERSVVDPRSAKLDRLRRVIVEASKQCRRDRLMDLDSPTPWSSVVEQARQPVRLIAHPGGPGIAVMGLRVVDRPVILAIGPEGGFSSAEVDHAVANDWQVVGLGATVLRVETAALAASAILLALAGDHQFEDSEGKGE